MLENKMNNEDINNLFEKEWKKYIMEMINELGLSNLKKLPNDAWVKELARSFFRLGYGGFRK